MYQRYNVFFFEPFPNWLTNRGGAQRRFASNKSKLDQEHATFRHVSPSAPPFSHSPYHLSNLARQSLNTHKQPSLVWEAPNLSTCLFRVLESYIVPAEGRIYFIPVDITAFDNKSVNANGSKPISSPAQRICCLVGMLFLPLRSWPRMIKFLDDNIVH